MGYPSKREQTEKLFREYRAAGRDEKRNEIVELYLHLADILARKYSGRGLEYDDLYQVAAFALLKAVERFDPEKGVQFTSFATPTIIGEIKKHFRDTAWALKVPRRLKEIATSISDAKERFLNENGRIPTPSDLAKMLGVTEDEVLEAMEGGRAFSAYSLDYDKSVELDPDNETTYFEKYMGDEEQGYEEVELAVVLGQMLADLSEREKSIIKKRFLEEMTQREVAEALGLSQMTISRIEKAMRNKFQTEYRGAEFRS